MNASVAVKPVSRSNSVKARRSVPAARRAHLLADGQRVHRRAERAQLGQRRAADRRAQPLLGNVAVERARHVGHEHRLQAERFDDAAQLVEVAGEVAAGRTLTWRGRFSTGAGSRSISPLRPAAWKAPT
jgi:hypothetical protein